MRQRQRILAVTKGHKSAPGPSANAFFAVTQGHTSAPGPSTKAFWWSQKATNSHQAPVLAHPGGLRRSHTHTRPQRQHILAVTTSHKLAASPSASVSWRSQVVTYPHQAPATACPGGHKRSQTRTRPQRQRILLARQCHKLCQVPLPACPGGDKRSQTLSRPE